MCQVNFKIHSHIVAERGGNGNKSGARKKRKKACGQKRGYVKTFMSLVSLFKKVIERVVIVSRSDRLKL